MTFTNRDRQMLTARDRIEEAFAVGAAILACFVVIAICVCAPL